MADTVLFELAELDSLVPGSLDTATATLARTMATSLVQAYTGQTLFLVAGDTVDLPGAWGAIIDLPQRPVVNVSAVSLGGLALGTPSYSVLGNSLYRPGGWYPSVAVTYTHGYETIPGPIRAAALGIARRLYENPGGYRSETIGSYSYTVGGAADAVGGLTLTADEKLLLRRYTRRATTLSLA